jgi:hypothetical protein
LSCENNVYSWGQYTAFILSFIKLRKKSIYIGYGLLHTKSQ